MKNEIYKYAFSHTDDGMFVHDDDLNILDINPAAEKITGYSRDDIIGKQCSLIFRGSLCDHNCDICKDSENDKKADFETDISSKDGRRFVVRVSSYSFKANKNKNYFFVVIKDVTELSKLKEKFIEVSSFHNIVGKNEKMQEIYRLVKRVAETNSTVLIYGETGTGKELIASAIHYRSDRKKNEFVRINCAALPENLLESELFGHIKGAFTGATRDRKGRFETASGGTIFLDEVGDTSPAFQAKLLRVLQEREIERVGDNRPIKINIRILAATNKNLLNLVKQNKFREDLYFRLSVVTIDLPPLRERQDDIPLLIEHVLAELNAKSKNKVKGVVVYVIKLLMAYPWPGNIRELKNAIEHAFVFSKNTFIVKEDLPSYLKSFDVSDSIADDIDLSQIPEQERIRKTLHLCRWNVKATAEKMNMSRTTLWRKMKKLGIN
ncbi:MAG: hypothetical protein CMH78_03215 [Nitrospinae bacterium]|nr:hypothetical protein [Nitrospinota bacterium]HJP17671.1 sigma 54-interacting transcriptional regulator [Nitrospinota bacterium]|tara:strand:- start:334 stop:1644 length:1311 start_codon:yes stop_codon:yes gene_type:complete